MGSEMAGPWGPWGPWPSKNIEMAVGYDTVEYFGIEILDWHPNSRYTWIHQAQDSWFQG